MIALETVARTLWIGAANYAKYTFCSRCGLSAYCRAKRASGPYVCLDCFDQNGGF